MSQAPAISPSRDDALPALHGALTRPFDWRRLPPPIKRIIGTLSDVEKVLVGLEIKKTDG